MAKGISVFLGMDYSLENNLDYMCRAKNSGFNRIFTSLHIPEANYEQIISDFSALLDLAKQLQMEVIADISPNAYIYLGVNPDDLGKFKQLGLHGIRLDYGFKPEKIAEYSQNDVGLLIELNASTMTADFIEQIMTNGANPHNLSACHNYYPRQNTGIGETSLSRKNKLFHQYNIPVSAFVALPDSRRAPLYEGLPTLEFTRHFAPAVASQILLQLGVDHVYIGDAIATNDELNSISNLNIDVINLELASYSPEYNELFNAIHTNRPDSAEDVVRSQESRLILLENSYISRKVTPHDCVERKIGAITIDNQNYLRYSGELQIMRQDLPADSRVNVIGQLTDESCYLLKFIGDNQQFRFTRPKQ